MGWRFSLEHANIVAYITTPEKKEPPRLTRFELKQFLGSIQDPYRDKPPLISSDPEWIDRVKQTAGEGLRYIESLSGSTDEFLEDYEIERILLPLRPLLGNFKLFGLAVGSYRDNKELEAFVEFAALSSREHALFLIPDYSSEVALSVLDPFPPIILLTEQLENWPGILFWTNYGAAAFAPLHDAYKLYQLFLEAFEIRGHGPFRIIDKVFESYTSPKESKKLLHLSDLHFGKLKAAENEAYLSAHLDSVARAVDRVVITGDLFDNPKRRDAIAFRNFRASLTRLTGKDVIVIPGNHDQKWFGNSILKVLGRRLLQLSNLEWSNLIIDENMQCVFFCFDSSRDADFAKGKVTTSQMMEVATDFETKCAARPALRDYLAVALVHHHPFSFETESETFIQKGLERIGLNDEYFLRMENADQFLNWCAKRKISVILHGHKHIPRYVSKRINVTENDKRISRVVTAVGCGTSLGAENKPLSYDVLTWDSSSKRWAVSFYEDPGDGSGFARRYISLLELE